MGNSPEKFELSEEQEERAVNPAGNQESETLANTLPLESDSSETEEEKISQRGAHKKILGMPKAVTISVFAFVMCLVSVAIWIGVSKYLEQVAQEREQAEVTYEGAYETYEVSLTDYTSVITKAEDAANEISEKNVTEASVLTAFQTAFGDLEVDISEVTIQKLNIDEYKNDELYTASEELEQVTALLDQEAEHIGDELEILLDDVEQKEIQDEEERQAKELAEKKKKAKTIGYEELFRAGDEVFGTYFKFEGAVIQDAGSGTYRVNMTKEPGYSRVFWRDTILVSVTGTTEDRILEDDIISFTALSFGIESYESIFGQTIELPLVLADAEDVKITGRAD